MNPFVEECRREWKRLGVPDPVANEMAADLSVDLAEAEADGTSAEEVLGTGAFDAPSFAAAWAAERGVIPPSPPPSEPARTRRSRAPFAIAAFALVAVIGAVLLLLPRPTVQARQAVGAPFKTGAAPQIIKPRLHITRPGRVVLPPFPAAAGVVIEAAGPNPVVRALGVLLLIVGLGGAVLTTLYVVRGSKQRAAPTG